MNSEQFISLLKQPENVQQEHVADLKEIVELYPYFVQPRLLLVKALKQSNSIHFERNLKLAAIQSFNRRGLFYYLYPEKKLSVEQFHRENAGKSSGDYFDMIDSVERNGGDTKQSLKLLAEKLKSARNMVSSSVLQAQPNKEEKAEIINHEPELIQNVVVQSVSAVKPESVTQVIAEISEEYAKKCIQSKKYSEAIEILKKLNLNNPKKSVYFADQIRFLEKVISNSKK
jgi:hypothetical protein